jgi:hypothetical protein
MSPNEQQQVDEVMDAMGLCVCGNPKTNNFPSTRYEDGFRKEARCCSACGRDVYIERVVEAHDWKPRHATVDC